MWTYAFFWHSQGCVISDSFPHCYTSWPKALGDLGSEAMRHLLFFIFFGKPQTILRLVCTSANTHTFQTMSLSAPKSLSYSSSTGYLFFFFFFLAAELCLSICLSLNAICKTPMCAGPCIGCFRSLLNSQFLPGSL